MTPREVIGATALVFRLPVEAIVARNGGDRVRDARAAAAFVLREMRSDPIRHKRVGQILGLADPANKSFYLVKRARRLRQSNPRYRLLSDALLVAALSTHHAYLQRSAPA